MRTFIRFIVPVIVGFSFVPAGLARAQEPPLRISRIEGPIVLDAVIDEPGWQRIDPLPLTTYKPVFGAPLTERTVVRIGYDSDALYISGELYDAHPDGPSVHSLTRDVDLGGDFFNVLLDTFNDNENGLLFVTTPGGNRLDAAINNDAEGTAFFSQAWNGFWDVATRTTSEGWFAEMRIPFSTLRFQERDGEVVMGFIFNRLIGRKNERQIFPAVEPLWAFGQFKPSRGRDIVLEGIESRRPLYVTPYVLTGPERQARLLDPAGPFDHAESWRREVGGDIKYGLSDNLTLDVTLNTDFAEVETDDQRVNLTRFPLFFPERRQFFLERAGIFDFSLGGVDRLFHSRRIGLDNTGAPVRLLGGARVVGRAGEWDIGVLDVQADDSGDLAAENLGVARIRRRVLNPNSAIGAIATGRRDGGSAWNSSLGVDGIINVVGNDYLTFALARTDSDLDTGDARGFLANGSARASYERRSTEGFGFSGAATSIGSAFDPGLGFVERRDIVRFDGEAFYGRATPESGVFRLLTPGVATELTLGNTDGDIETGRVEGRWGMETNASARIDLSVGRQFESLDEPFALSESAVVPPGDYTFYDARAELSPAQGWTAGAGGSVRAGSFFDGNLVSIDVSPFWIVSPGLRLSGEYRYDRATFDRRDETFRSHIVRLRAQTAYDARLSANAFIQLNSSADVAVGNVRFRYNFREGNDLWIVWNQVFNTDVDRVEPALPRTETSVVLLKYTYTFRN